MKPEEKAKELTERFLKITYWEKAPKQAKARAKQCALICVDELIKNNLHNMEEEYWQQVKTEIEKQ